jgi:hypothetical protein
MPGNCRPTSYGMLLECKPDTHQPDEASLIGVPLSLAFVVRIMRLFSISTSCSSYQAAALPGMVAMTFWTDLDMVWQDMGTGYDRRRKVRERGQ